MAPEAALATQRSKEGVGTMLWGAFSVESVCSMMHEPLRSGGVGKKKKGKNEGVRLRWWR